MRGLKWGWLLAGLLAAPAAADIVKLRNGGTLEGYVTGSEGDTVHLETASGRVAVQKKDVAAIDFDHESAVEVWNGMWPSYRARKEPEIFCFLAHWCEANGLGRKAKEMKERLFELDPDHDYTHGGPRATKVEERPDPPKSVPIPKTEKKRDPTRIYLAPTWVPPLAQIGEDGSIVYPPDALPGPTHLGLAGLDVPYWGIQPSGMPRGYLAESFLRMKADYSNQGLWRALRTWNTWIRERDVLLIPPNRGEVKHWRLIWSLAPKDKAIEALQKVRTGKLQAKERIPAPLED